MPSYSELLFSLLSTAPAFTALAADRAYPVWLPQGAALPAVAYQIISALPNCEEKQLRVQVSLFARTYAELNALDAAVQSVLDGYEAPGVYIGYLDGRDGLDTDSSVYFRPTDYRLELSAT